MKFARAVLIALCLVVLASCSDKDSTVQPPPATDPTDPTTVPTPTPTPTPAPTPTPSGPSQPSGAIPTTLKLTPFAQGFDLPLYITPVPGQNQHYVVEKGGRIKVIDNGQVLSQAVLDISSLVSDGPEQGLLGLAIHPKFQENGFIYINYTDNAPGPQNTQVIRYTVTNNVANPASAKTILSFPQPRSNHNGGMMLFGPDGYLYIGTGDGGVPNDTDGNSQTLNTYLGKILRIDIDNGDPYSIPAGENGNPFAPAENVKAETWSFGLRNPWRFSFDRETGDMWLADVGEKTFDEVNFKPATQPSGVNYGWPCKEASKTVDVNDSAVFCGSRTFTDPVLEYSQPKGMSVTGGYVYRGKTIPELQSRYIYGDFLSGKIWFLTKENDKWTKSDWPNNNLPPLTISSFGEDTDGEIFVVHFGDEKPGSGIIYKLAK